MVANLPALAALFRGSDLRILLVNPAYQAIAPSRPMVGKTVDEAWPEAAPGLAERCR